MASAAEPRRAATAKEVRRNIADSSEIYRFRRRRARSADRAPFRRVPGHDLAASADPPGSAAPARAVTGDRCAARRSAPTDRYRLRTERLLQFVRGDRLVRAGADPRAGDVAIAV